MGLETLLRTFQSDQRILHASAADAIERLLTVDGRTGGADRSGSLANLDLGILRVLQERRSTRITPVAGTLEDCEVFRIYYNLLGRLHIRPVADTMLDYGLGGHIEIGFFSLSRSEAARARRLAAQADQEEEPCRARLDAALNAANEPGRLGQIVAGAIDAVQHVEAVCLYIGDEMFVAMERFTNLVTTKRGAGLLNALVERPLSDWCPTHRLLVAALHTLYLSGRSIRFEEFNGLELSARRLFSRLSELGAGYCAALGVEEEPPQEPFALGSWVGGLAGRMQDAPRLRYRRTSGLTFQKCEHLRPSVGPSEDSVAVSPRLIALHRSWCEHESRSSFRPMRLLHELADHAIEDALLSSPAWVEAPDADAQEKTKLEVLIEEIVASAVTATGADYGMSSSIRRPGCLFGESPSEVHHAVLKLTPKDFFCCIVGTQQLQRTYGEKLEWDVFRAVQARMQFNRWHFIAGNLARAVVPEDRHYFYPPVMPDLAEWSDQFHAGHTRAGVRYAVRAPGPDTGCPPLKISGIEFRGFYDVRVVRVEGQPFDLRDLTTVRAHCLWLGVIWNRIVARCDANPEARVAIVFSSFVNGNGLILDRDEPVASGALVRPMDAAPLGLTS
jgi:hypothetical protein